MPATARPCEAVAGSTLPESATDGAATRGRRRGFLRHVGTVLPYLIIVCGLAVLLYPVANAWWEAWEASQGIDAIVSTYDEMSDPERAALRAEARHYNEVLAEEGDLGALAPYDEQLSFRGSEMIAYIAIPKCSVRLPIYHGTEDKVLMAGVGHLEGTSLPAGGDSSHCVLTAHTGMPGRRMFDDIHLLEAGDEFVIWVLGEPLAYRVTDSEVVLPTEIESLAIRQGSDLCTLVTCTPYGVNSHRLLVHARRCEYVEGAEEMSDVAVYVNNRTLPLLAAITVLLLLVTSWMAHRRRMRRRRQREQARDAR